MILLATHAPVQERAVVLAVQDLLTYIMVHVVQHVLLDTIQTPQITSAKVSFRRIFKHPN